MKKRLELGLNRVEGDLEILLDYEDGRISEAWCKGTMYRGFEQLLLGRASMDSLVFTPRICGICGTAHLYAAVLALEDAWNIVPPPLAVMVRNACLMAEEIQSDIRHTMLFFAPDFLDPIYRGNPMEQELLAAFEPFKGHFYLDALRISREALAVVANFGGQWPHSSYMVPGGVVGEADPARIMDSMVSVDRALRWYENEMIGTDLDTWLGVDSLKGLEALLSQERPARSVIGLLTRRCRELDLHKTGRGVNLMLSGGCYRDPDGGGEALRPSGVLEIGQSEPAPMDHLQIAEHVRYSWFRQYKGGLHPWDGETIPHYQPFSDRYTWAKAPRYQGRAVQTGPLAQLAVAGDKLLLDLLNQEGDSAWLRQLARMRRPALTLSSLKKTLENIMISRDGPHFVSPGKDVSDQVQGFGVVEAARGFLGHWIKLRGNRIVRYQIITPTAWNASPRDSEGVPGHWEQSLAGLEVDEASAPVRVGHVVRSHDPCLVCTVHAASPGRREPRWTRKVGGPW